MKPNDKPIEPSPEVLEAMLWLLYKGGNLKAHVHALMHCNPRIAKMNGYPSMRSSAKECGCSPEYIRQLRNLYRKELKLESKPK